MKLSSIILAFAGVSTNASNEYEDHFNGPSVTASRSCTGVYSDINELFAAISNGMSTGLENDILTVSDL